MGAIALEDLEVEEGDFVELEVGLLVLVEDEAGKSSQRTKIMEIELAGNTHCRILVVEVEGQSADPQRYNWQ